MPATYAHWRFGDECYKTLSPKYKKIVDEHRDLYDIGVHGPDIFFYDLKEKDVTSYGSDMHNIPARNFFERCRVIYKSHSEKEKMMAYILGFLTHFDLDANCHGYICEKVIVDNITHNKIESEYDRHLLELDKKKSTENRAKTLNPSKENARIISFFFPFNENTVYKTIKAQKQTVSFLSTRTHVKKEALRLITKKLNASHYFDLITDKKEFEPCKDSNLRIDKLKKKALDMYPKLLKNIIGYFKEEEKLCEFFDNDFSSNFEDGDIQVLSYEEEQKYKV